MNNDYEKTIATLRAAFEAGAVGQMLPGGGFGKSTFSQSGTATGGLTYYDLEAGAKFLYPVLTPLRNATPRVSGKGGIQANWRAVTAINTSGIRLGVSGGNRGGVMAVATKDYIAAYRGIGLENSVDFEAQYAGEGFDDVRAIAARTLLESMMIGEEFLILGGDNSLALGTTPTPSATGNATGGSIADATYSVIAVALTLDGFANGSVVGGIQTQITRVNADGSTDTFGGGSAKQSAAASATVSGGSGNGSVSASVAVVNGAVGYAWFFGAAGSEKLAAITTINSVVLKVAAAGTQTALSLGTVDSSQNNLVFDGLMTQAFATGSNAYVSPQVTGTAGTGTPLTADNEGGIVEIDALLKSLWDNYRLSPTQILVSSQEALNISKKILTNGGTSGVRYTRDLDDGMVAGGVMIKDYLNRFSMNGGQAIPVKIHPNMPAGTLLALTDKLPYPLSNVGNVYQMRTRQEYYQMEWPLRSRKYEYGVYADEVLQHYFPPSMGIITNIGNG